VLWFSSLVAKQTHLKAIYEALRSVKADMVQTIPMGQGNKSSRLVAWTFQDKTARAVWREKRWIKKPKS
jgi:23S rRNA (adenine1618-N6)-methyltransferase